MVWLGNQPVAAKKRRWKQEANFNPSALMWNAQFYAYLVWFYWCISRSFAVHIFVCFALKIILLVGVSSHTRTHTHTHTHICISTFKLNKCDQANGLFFRSHLAFMHINRCQLISQQQIEENWMANAVSAIKRRREKKKTLISMMIMHAFTTIGLYIRFNNENCLISSKSRKMKKIRVNHGKWARKKSARGSFFSTIYGN